MKRSAFIGSETTDGKVQLRCLEWSRSVSDRVLAAPPDIVFLSSFAVGEEIDDGPGRPRVGP